MNNYFALFYIAYLRQIEFMGAKKECDKSCLGELQTQMMVVFTGKTFGLQLVELAKPFVKNMIGTLLTLMQVKKLMQSASDGVTSLVKLPLKVANNVVDSIGGQPGTEDVSTQAVCLRNLRMGIFSDRLRVVRRSSRKRNGWMNSTSREQPNARQISRCIYVHLPCGKGTLLTNRPAVNVLMLLCCCMMECRVCACAI